MHVYVLYLSFLLQVCVRSCSLLFSCIQCHTEQNCLSLCDHVTIVSPSEYNSTDEGEEWEEREEGEEGGRERERKLKS